MPNEPNPEESAIAVEVLRKARALLAGEVFSRTSPLVNGANKDEIIPAWCPCYELHAQEANSRPCDPWYELTAKWSVIGALARYGMRPIPLSPLPGMRDETRFNAAWKYLFMAALVKSGGTSTVNGINNQGWEATKELLDFAIKLAENQAELLLTLAVEPDSELGREMKSASATVVPPKWGKPS